MQASGSDGFGATGRCCLASRDGGRQRRPPGRRRPHRVRLLGASDDWHQSWFVLERRFPGSVVSSRCRLRQRRRHASDRAFESGSPLGQHPAGWPVVHPGAAHAPATRCRQQAGQLASTGGKNCMAASASSVCALLRAFGVEPSCTLCNGCYLAFDTHTTSQTPFQVVQQLVERYGELARETLA